MGSTWDSGRRNSRRAPHFPPISLKPSNLRRISPVASSTSLSLVGSVSPHAIFNLFGERGWGLPDHVAKDISQQLLIEKVCKEEVVVSGCSSTRGDFPLEGVLADDDSWWISDQQSMPMGVGEEYLEFSFGAIPRRVEFICLRIPPLPSGPLSVRNFHLQALE